MKLRTISLFFLAGILASCSSAIKVTSDFDKETEFSKFKTFTFYQLTDKGPGLSELNQHRIIDAIWAEMIKKGFVEDKNNPDVLINATAIVKDKKQITGTNYYGYGGYYRPYAWGPGYGGITTYNVYEYHDGSLIIDVIDESTKRLVWQGTGNKEIDVPLKNADTIIPTSVAKILAGFPPKKSK